MAVVQPPVTGDAQQDSWAYQITQLINSGAIGTGGVGTGVGGGSGTGPQGSSGFSAATLYLFTRTTSDTAPTTISEDLVYTYASAELRTEGNDPAPFSDGTDDIWYDFVPDDTQQEGDYVWTIVVHVADTAATENIAASVWSTPALISRPGQDGVNVLIEARTATNDSADWVSLSNTEDASPFFKNGEAEVLGLVARVYEAGGEILLPGNTEATYEWSKNGAIDFVLMQAQAEDPDDSDLFVTGKDKRVLLINETDVDVGNINEVFTCKITY